MKKDWGFPKAFLFDLDGVLIDSEPLHGQAWEKTASVFNLKLSPDSLRLLQGKRRVDCAKQILTWINDPPELKELLAIHKPISRKLIIKAKAMPGSEKLVRWCFENNLLIALVTSSSRESVKIKCAPHEWLNIFSERVLGDDPLLLNGKPYPDPYLLAATTLKVNAKDCWAIEDSISGATSALKAGCTVWFINTDKEQSIDTKLDYSEKRLIRVSDLNIVLKALKDINHQ